MGYRHQVISDTLIPEKKSLPLWFVDKYKGLVDFDRSFWVSTGEYKRYGVFSDLEKDLQKVLKQINWDYSVRLVFFADESDENNPDISHVLITANKIVEIQASEWAASNRRY